MKNPLFSVPPEDLKRSIEPTSFESDEERRAYKNGVIQGRLAAQALVSQYEAEHDDLTGLLNKKALKKDIGKRIKAARDGSGGTEFGIFFADLTNFKKANDDLGHERVDKLLQDFAPKLNSVLRTDKNREEHFIVGRDSTDDRLAHERIVDNDIVSEAGRYGGDEFAGAVDLTPTEESGREMSPQERLDAVARRIHDTFHQFIAEQEPAVQAVGVDIAIGTQLWKDGMSVSDLMSYADQNQAAVKSEQHERLGKYRS